MNKAKEISITEFENSVLKSKKIVLVDFWAPWCGPCLMMAPILDELSNDEGLSKDLEIMKVNTDIPENMPLAQILQIQSIPNMKVFYKGKIVHEFVGARPKEMFRKELADMIEKITK